MNIDLAVQMMVYLWIANAICRILLGATHTKKSTHYNAIDALVGIITLAVVIIYIL
jgi:hypothetical protein